MELTIPVLPSLLMCSFNKKKNKKQTKKKLVHSLFVNCDYEDWAYETGIFEEILVATTRSGAFLEQYIVS